MGKRERKLWNKTTTYEMDAASHHLTINVSSTQTLAQCPVCGCASDRVHSCYERTLADLPCGQLTMIWLVQVCKFFCSNSNCPRRIFCERISKVAAPWARKTLRLVEQLQALGLPWGVLPALSWESDWEEPDF